jgi:prepilin-type processing-associated H-X9-DG protein
LLVQIRGELSAARAAEKKNEAQLRAECANNLKMMGLVFKMYANEHKNERFPMIDGRRGNLIVDANTIFPEYLTDLSVLQCPADTKVKVPAKADDVMDQSYFYLGWVVTTEEEGLALLDAYESLDLEKRGEDVKVAEGKGTVGGNKILRLREGIERFLITDINQPGRPRELASKVPIMWDRPGQHGTGGGNVLYIDGRVEFVKYPGKFPMTEKFIKKLEKISAKKKAK